MSARQDARAQKALAFTVESLTIATVYARWAREECAVVTRYKGQERRVYSLRQLSTLGLFSAVLSDLDAPVMLDGNTACQRTTAIRLRTYDEGMELE